MTLAALRKDQILPGFVKKLSAIDADYEFAAEFLRIRQAPSTLANRLRVQRMLVERNFFAHYFTEPPSWRLLLRQLRDSDRVLPDFASVGATKCGTSDLANHLLSHPSVVAPLAKEIWVDEPASWRPYYPTRAEMDEVAGEHGRAITGFFAPWLHRVALMDKFKAARPDGKVIILLRDPVDRAYSHFKWELAHGGPECRSLEYFADYDRYVDLSLDLYPSDPPMIGNSFQVLQSGIYVNAVKRWHDVFGAENVLVVNCSDMFADVATTLKTVQAFLGIAEREPQALGIVNPSPTVDAPRNTETARAKLVEFYRPWNERLYEYLGRDLGWK